MNEIYSFQLEQFEEYSLAMLHIFENMSNETFDVPEFTPRMRLIDEIVSKLNSRSCDAENHQSYDLRVLRISGFEN